ncbi:MAG: recombination mediator RecR [Candidatus Shapirobacteria bacterium]|nr:recombination mediator RecR [Candidatus Shapirobacteria bacterium]
MAEFPVAIKNLITAFERLPGIGPKSATRLVFYLLNTPQSFIDNLSNSLLRLKKDIKICSVCFSVGDTEVCSICSDNKRNKNVVCVVERAIDVMVIENMGGFKGVYHVLGGAVNPLDHIGPDDLKIVELLQRIRKMVNEVDKKDMEIILATNPTMEGEATALYIKRRIEEIDKEVNISRIGSGLPIGADLEYADQATLSRALDGRRSI